MTPDRWSYKLEIQGLAFDLECESRFDPTDTFLLANEAHTRNDLVRLAEIRDALDLQLKKVRAR